MPRTSHSSAFSENFKIDPSSPSGLSWITKHSGVCKTVAGHQNSRGYWKVKLNNNVHHVAAIVLELAGQRQPTAQHTVDHINRNRADNRLINLRWANRSVQSQNRSSWSSAKYKFVTQLPNGRFRAHGYLKGKYWSAGCHQSAYAAHKSALAKRLELSWI